MNTPASSGITIVSRLTTEEAADRGGNHWATEASQSLAAGHGVEIEGVDWRQACRDHGFFGAIAQVKARHRARVASYRAALAEEAALAESAEA